MKKIFFFNGWGMDETILKDIKNTSEYELEIINFPYDIKNKEQEMFNEENEIIFIAWSFGVYYLNKFLEKNLEKIQNLKSIAINGVPNTIGEFGINKKMFDLTLKTLSEENLKKFYKNMDKNFLGASGKSFEAIKNELIYFKENYKISEKNYIDFYYIGKYDRIILGRKQEKYCIDNEIDYRLLECSHYPFYLIKDFIELVKF